MLAFLQRATLLLLCLLVFLVSDILVHSLSSRYISTNWHQLTNKYKTYLNY